MTVVEWVTEVDLDGFVCDTEAEGDAKVFKDILSQWKGGHPEGGAKMEIFLDLRAVSGESVGGKGPGEQYFFLVV